MWLRAAGPGSTEDEVGPDVDLRRNGWRRWAYPSVWLVYLAQTVSDLHAHSSGASVVLGWLILAAFAGVYVAALPITRAGRRAPTVRALVVLALLVAAEAPLAQGGAFVMCVYMAVLAMSGLGPWGPVTVAGLTVVAVVVPAAVPSWHSSFNWDMAVTIPIVAFAMYGFFVIMRSNRELNAARAEVARLAAENERSRIARDLHDLLGHSLATITVKAGLARRLVDHDPARAAREIGEVEELTRSTLSDVRAAVAGYREVLLAGELATAAGVLRAAGITAHLPGAVDAVRPQYRELFGWVVREGVTNIVRHSRARSCTITVGADWLELVDDGGGGGNCAGNGLAGLGERVELAGGTLVAERPRMGGWLLRADMTSAETTSPPTSLPHPVGESPRAITHAR